MTSLFDPLQVGKLHLPNRIVMAPLTRNRAPDRVPNDLMLAYQDADVSVRLATEVYKTALATLETTRLDAVRKVKYLISVDKPSLPDSAELPRVTYWTLMYFWLFASCSGMNIEPAPLWLPVAATGCRPEPRARPCGPRRWPSGWRRSTGCPVGA